MRHVGLPRYEFRDYTNIKYGPGIGKYQIAFTVTNPTPYEGVICVYPFTRNSNPERESAKKTFILEAYQSKRVGMMTTQSYESIVQKYSVSQHLPSGESKWLGTPVRGELDPVCNDIIEVETPVNDENSIIVDDSDDGFQIVAVRKKQKPLEALYRKKKVTPPLLNYHPSLQYREWTPVIDNLFYGATRRTAHIIRSGDGTQKVSWTADIPEHGRYDLYYNNRFYFENRMVTIVHVVGDLHFTVHENSGPREVVLSERSEWGWAYLGTFGLDEGKAIVELSDESDGWHVYADAIKWEKHED